MTSSLYAQTDYHNDINCAYSPGKVHNNFSRERVYYINTSEFKRLADLNEDVVEAVIVSAAETWNSMGNVGTLTYGGRTTIETVDDELQYCIENNRYINLVTMVEVASTTSTMNANAVMRKKCVDSLNNPNISEKFLFEVHAKRTIDGNVAAIDWRTKIFTDSTCSLQTDSKDLEGMAVHEFGHAFNLDHTPNGEVASMNPSSSSYCWLSGNFNDAKWSDVRRDLWAYDMHCSKNYANGSAQRGTDVNNNTNIDVRGYPVTVDFSVI